MATAEDILKGAYERFGIKDAETPLTTQEKTDGISIINDTMLQLGVEGFDLGYTAITAISDTFTVSDNGYLNFIKLQIGARVAQGEEIPISQTIAEDLKASRRSVIRDINRRALSGASRGTYRYMIYRAIEALGAKSADEPISAQDQTNGIDVLTDIMLGMEGDNFGLGFQIGTTLDTQTNIPDWAYRWIIADLAIDLSSSFSVNPPANVVLMSQNGREEALRRTHKTLDVSFPDTLPVGTENASFDGYSGYFGRNDSDDILNGSNDGVVDSEGNPILIDTP